MNSKIGLMLHANKKRAFRKQSDSEHQKLFMPNITVRGLTGDEVEARSQRGVIIIARMSLNIKS